MLLLFLGLFVSNMKIIELMKELQHTQDGSSCLESTKLFTDTTDTEEGEEDIDPCQARIGISG